MQDLTPAQLLEENPPSKQGEGETPMQWNVYPHEDGSGDWVVQAINFAGDGEIYTTIFSDSNAEARAREYYDWKRSTKQMAA